MSKIIGIDLGTTNSCMATVENGRPVIIPNAEGERTTPSVVSFDENGERIVGTTAKRQAIINPEMTVSSIKRQMGLNKKIKVGENSFYPQEISAMILKKLKDDASAYLGEDVRDAVITVPAYFNDAQRQATKDAGKIAGLNVMRIINEPTAAALAYGVEKEENSRVLIYDFGGGTFDISILEIHKDVFEVIGTKGNNHLGGDDMDQKIIDFFLDKFSEKDRDLIKNDKTAMQRLKEASEKAKIQLSSSKTANINLPFLSSDKNGPIHFKYNLTREEFEGLISKFVLETIELLKDALKDSSLTPDDIDKILLVGGTTRIPLIKRLIKQTLNKDPYKEINPDECVAAGAAIQSAIINGTMSDLLLLDVTPLSLGVETHGGVFTKLIERNSTIPIKKSQIFSTVTNDQSQVEIHVLQGEREIAAYNKSLGKFILTDIPPAPRGVPQILVTFDIDVNGIVHVSAKDLNTGHEQGITIHSSSNLSADEIDKAIKDAQKYADVDAEHKKQSELIDRADKLIESSNSFLNKYRDNLSDSDIEKIKGHISDLNMMVTNKKYDFMDAEIEKFENTIEAVMQNAIVDNSDSNSEEKK